MTNCKYIDDYIEKILNEDIVSSKEIKKAMKLVRKKLDDSNVVIKIDMIEKAIELIEKYFKLKLLDWQLFIIGVIHCYYKTDNSLVFSEFLIVMGRGNGKNGFASPLIWYLTTHYHGIKGYNIDIIANNEEQAKTSFEDVHNALEDNWDKMKSHFTKTKMEIINKKTNSYIKFNTSNARTKDGKRSACLIFDEIHEYETYDTIKVFTSGFGKRKHSRTIYITTNGYVRGGVLDEQIELAQDVLDEKIKDDLGLLPLIYKIDEKEDALDPNKWIAANPSLPYFPELKKEMDKDAIKMKYQPHKAIDFLTKRMNYPAEDNYTVIAEWKKILATNQPIPYEELEGAECIGAIDYAQIKDFCSVGLLFKKDGKRIFIEHTFVCHLALQVESRAIKFPVREMADRGLITIVKEDLIQPKYVADWFIEQSRKYNIVDIVADSYRKSLLDSVFEEHGLPLNEVRSGPITHAKIAPLVESLFANEDFIFGDNPTMRWYVNNCYQQLDAKGNTTYLKIEPQTRKTDGFFSLIHALSKDHELQEVQEFVDLGVYTY